MIVVPGRVIVVPGRVIVVRAASSWCGLRHRRAGRRHLIKPGSQQVLTL
jgi:hypothetical protein